MQPSFNHFTNIFIHFFVFPLFSAMRPIPQLHFMTKTLNNEKANKAWLLQQLNTKMTNFLILPLQMRFRDCFNLSTGKEGTCSSMYFYFDLKVGFFVPRKCI